MEALKFFTQAVGRYVNGDHITKRARDSDNRPIPEGDQKFEFGVAFQKADLWPQLSGEIYQYLAGALGRDPNAMQRMQNWFTTFQGFSMKIADGDAPNKKGQYNEHTRGCFVVYFSSSYPPKCVDASNNEIDPAAVKRGYYVQIAGTIKPNDQPGDRAGIYVNGNFIRLVGEGDVITGGMSAEDAFGGAAAPAALPPGARPVGSSSGAAGAFGAAPGAMPGAAPMMPGAAGMQQPPAAVPDQTVPVQAQAVGYPAAQQPTASPTSPPPGVQPHTGILNPGQPQQQQQQFQPPALPGMPG